MITLIHKNHDKVCSDLCSASQTRILRCQLSMRVSREMHWFKLRLILLRRIWLTLTYTAQKIIEWKCNSKAFTMHSMSTVTSVAWKKFKIWITIIIVKSVATTSVVAAHSTIASHHCLYTSTLKLHSICIRCKWFRRIRLEIGFAMVSKYSANANPPTDSPTATRRSRDTFAMSVTQTFVFNAS